jgi:hypothetical protein
LKMRKDWRWRTYSKSESNTRALMLSDFSICYQHHEE